MKLAAASLLVLVAGSFPAQAASIKGHVRDASSREAIPSTVVSLTGTELGTLTGPDGYYLVTGVPPGAYEVRYTAIGYEEQSRSVLVVGDTLIALDVRLSGSPIAIREVTVTARRAEFKQATKVSSLTMTRSQLRSTPLVVESDLFRSLQTLPGIVTTSDFSAASFVRGGNADQNLVLLDGVSIYNPTHLGGVFSIFDPEVVSMAELMTGGFPAEYGGRLSSVLDIRTREGNAERLAGSLGSSLLASRFVLEGPLPNDSVDASGPLPRGSFFLSGRRTYFDRLLGLLDYDFPYYFYDLAGKADFNYGEQARLALAGFLSTDRLSLGSGGNRVYVDWGNRLASANWLQYWSPYLSTRTALTYNNYFYDIELASGIISVRDTINEVGLKSVTTWRLPAANQVDAGIDLGYSTFRYNANLLGGIRFDVTGKPLLGAAFVQGRLKPAPDLLLEPGLRLENYRLWGTYDANFWRLSPRLAAKYFLDDVSAIKAAAGRYNQYASALYPEFSPIPSLFFWVPIFGHIVPQRADHFILGAERWLDDNTNVSLEGYYKNYGRLYELNTGSKPESLETTLLRPGSGWSSGIDLLVKREWGKLSGWVSYSLGFARVTFDSLTYSPSYDRRHILNLVVNYALPAGFSAFAHFSYGSGLPYTATTGYYRRWHYNFNRDKISSDWVDIGGGKNAARYPDYHRLDIGIEKGFNIGRTRLNLQLDVINVYNHKNLLLYQWDYAQPRPLRVSVYQLPILPSLGLKWRF